MLITQSAPLPEANDLAAIQSGRVPKRGEFVQIPSSIFINKIDLHMPINPLLQEIELYQFETTASGASPLPSSPLPKLIKEKGRPYSALALTASPTVWVKSSAFTQVQKLAEDRILTPGTSGKLTPEQRMEALRRTALNTVEDLFNNPTEENVNKSVKVMSSFVHVLMKDPKAYLHLARLSSHDPYTTQHSVGAAVNAMILARKIGMTDEKELLDIGLGGLLHDIGKIKVRVEIINKQGPLDEEEWVEMREHSQQGFDLVADNHSLSEVTKSAILNHHEDKTGTGYPRGLNDSQIDRGSKIVCISDIFNALTTTRSYSSARTPFEALALMRDKMQHKLDMELFKHLVMIYGGKIEDIA